MNSDPVVTPTPTPELSPVAADPPAVPLTPPPLVAEEEAEVQLVEQSAEERVSAAVEEASPTPENPVASHCSSTEDSSTSSTTVGTEATYKAVSEGELLSHVQLGDTMTGTVTIIGAALCVHLSFHSSLSLFEEEALCSFSISLQDTVSIISLPLFQLQLFPTH